MKLPKSYAIALTEELVSVIAPRSIQTFSLATGKRISSANPLPNCSRLRFSPNGRRLAVKNTIGRLVVLDPLTGAITCDFNNHCEGEGSAPEFSRCGEYVVDGSWNGQLRVREATTGSIVASFSEPSTMIEFVQRVPNSSAIAVSWQPKTALGENFPACPFATLHEWPLPSAATARVRFEGAHALQGMSISPDGTHVAATHYGRGAVELAIYRFADGAKVGFADLELHDACEVCWMPHGDLIAALHRDRVAFYDVASLEARAACAAPSATRLCVASSGTLVAVASDIGSRLLVPPLVTTSAPER